MGLDILRMDMHMRQQNITDKLSFEIWLLSLKWQFDDGELHNSSNFRILIQKIDYDNILSRMKKR